MALQVKDDTGIYAIENLKDKRVYVGATKRGFLNRWSNHRSLLERGCHGVLTFQHDCDSHGPGFFKFIALEVCSPQSPSFPHEQLWMDRLSQQGFSLYNRVEARERPLSETFDEASVLYAVSHAARILGLHERTLRRLLEQGKFRGYRIGNQWKVPKSVIDELREGAAGNPHLPRKE